MPTFDRRRLNDEEIHPAVLLLIIDDNPGSVELLATALAQPGLEILTTSDPAEGIEDLFQPAVRRSF